MLDQDRGQSGVEEMATEASRVTDLKDKGKLLALSEYIKYKEQLQAAQLGLFCGLVALPKDETF